MNILNVSQYFWPESFVINDMMKVLKEQGHIVVATGKPNYPNDEIYNGYSASGVQKEKFDENIEVVRVPIIPRGNGGAIRLAINYFSFVWSGLRYFRKSLINHDFDVIFVFAISPITMALPAISLNNSNKAILLYGCKTFGLKT